MVAHAPGFDHPRPPHDEGGPVPAVMDAPLVPIQRPRRVEELVVVAALLVRAIVGAEEDNRALDLARGFERSQDRPDPSIDLGHRRCEMNFDRWPAPVVHSIRPLRDPRSRHIVLADGAYRARMRRCVREVQKPRGAWAALLPAGLRRDPVGGVGSPEVCAPDTVGVLRPARLDRSTDVSVDRVVVSVVELERREIVVALPLVALAVERLEALQRRKSDVRGLRLHEIPVQSPLPCVRKSIIASQSNRCGHRRRLKEPHMGGKSREHALNRRTLPMSLVA